MTKAFKKGDRVTYISDWDRKGTVYFVQAIVHSCGSKQMVLTNEATGEEMGRHFRPETGSLETVVVGPNTYRIAGGTFPRMTDDEAVAAGLKVAAAIQQYQREQFARCLAGGHSEIYNDAIRKNLAELHELRVFDKTAS